MRRVAVVRTGMLAGLASVGGFLLLCGGCPPQAPDGTGSATLTLGTKQELQSSVVPAGGGMVTLSQEGHALDGLTLDVPDGAFPADTTFTISGAPITGHNLGDLFNPLTPLISVDHGGGYADDLLVMTIPVTPTAGRFVMAFYYDAAEGVLEGLPMLAMADDSITICTRHFSDVVVSEVAYDLLLGEVETPFAVQQDNWQFDNLGTYLGPGGTCSGMCVSAMYYWDVLKRTRGPLYGRYDNNGDAPATPLLDFDDVDVIKLCGEAQYYGQNWIEKARQDWLDKGLSHNDLYAFYMCAYSMLLSGRPQYLSLYKEDDLKAPGHAVIVYRKSGYTLWVADPNESTNKALTIALDPQTGEMVPYTGRWNANTPEFQFDKMMYMARGALVNYDNLTELWAEHNQGAVGQDFPAYQLKVTAGTAAETDLTDGFETSEETIQVRVACDFTWKLIVYGTDQLEKSEGGKNSAVDLTLAVGDNVVGFYVLAERYSPTLKITDWAWTGFAWRTVRRTSGDGGTPDGGACSPSGDYDRWLIEWDSNCDGAADSDDLWHLREDYTVSDHWSGPILGYSWQVESGMLVIDSGSGVVWEAALGADCNSATDGHTYVDDEDNGNCWTARKY